MESYQQKEIKKKKTSLNLEKKKSKVKVTKTIEYRHKTTYMRNSEAESRAQK